MRIGQRDHARPAVAGVLHGAQRALGIAREAHADQHVPRPNAEHLLKDLAGAVCAHQRHIFKQKVKVKAQKVGQRARGAHAQDVNALGAGQRVHRALERLAVDLVERHADLLDVG